MKISCLDILFVTGVRFIRSKKPHKEKCCKAGFMYDLPKAKIPHPLLTANNRKERFYYESRRQQ